MTSFADSHVHDVVVVGNGSLGLSLGLVLARRGVRVAVLGRPHRPGGASCAAGAMIGAFGDVTTTSLKDKYGRTKLDWAYQAGKLWPEWLAGLPDGSDLLTADGTVVILNTVGLPEVDTQNYKAIRGALVDYSEEFEDVDPEDIDWLDPEPTARPLQAMFLPHEHAVNAPELLARLENAFIAAGGTLIAEHATRVDHRRGQVRGVELESGTVLSAEHVVLAAGVASQSLLDSVPEQAARIPRLVSGYGVAALVDTEDGTCPPTVIRTPSRDFGSALHVLPRGDGQVYLGATTVISPEPRETALITDAWSLLNNGNRQIRRSLGESSLRHVQAGNRPVTLDGMPLLGETELRGLWMMTGTHQDGLTLSPLLAREMTALLLGEQPTIDLDVFNPVRTPIQPLTRGEVVETTVTRILAGGYESNWTVPVEWPMLLEATLVTELYRDPPNVPSEVGARLNSHGRRLG
ncbi:glycine/D-amino acid oxidase-like deaminating enzyme [Kibdelosporangium banguiense]|uniref:Glycine/D-amino acid oxidase-like deaminating enzyme n=1 Tax=Kibdelosporangium banguiense TaxID=1365924 RepID=A0ABS4U1M8_9PSEU|nr:FAD-binding oxidoreductase [Kibdelosporangium banguiense]MBP2330547.1 glycine/D-amino acid oxidase-like deaminating enzyme [Kibdelosporangium banguiense]